MLYFIEADCNSIANAQYLQITQDKQPYVGLVRVCVRAIDVSNEIYYKTVLLHEITHAIGFSESVFQYMKDSSNNNYLKTKTTSDGVERKILATPKVTSFLKSHFECDSIEGGYLENQGGSGTANSHWETTSYAYELMTGWISSVKPNKLTNLTLNFLEDTGWYKVNYTYANQWLFGYKKGCEMAELKCSKTVNNEVVPIGDYCIIKKDLTTEKDISQCSSDYDSVGSCKMDSNYGYDCPIVQPYSNRMCYDVNNVGQYDYQTGIEYGSNSYCHYNGALQEGYVNDGEVRSSCLKTQCNVEDNSYSIYMCSKRGGGCTNMNEYSSVKCRRKGEEVSIAGYTGYIICSDPSVICFNNKNNDSGSGGEGEATTTPGLIDDNDDDYTGTDKDDGGGDGTITRRPTPRPITSTPDPTSLDDRSSGDFVVCIVVLLSIIFLIM